MRKNLKVLIVEDEHLAAEGLKSYVAEIEFLDLVAYCENALEANKILSEQLIDLIFLDIQMPKITGIEFLKSLSKPPMVIFTTAYPNYALQGYELDVIDYLVKPYPFDRFLKAVNKAKDRFVLENSSNQETVQDRELDYFFVKSEQRLEKVVINELCYVEAMENYVIIHTDSQKIISLMTMKSMEEKLPPNHFIRSHKSYIVNISKVESIEGNCLNVKSKQLPISRQNKHEVLNRIIR
ncbi:DNA-binding response regulator [Marivirga tractuosa]|uniref:Two component transcriptional regulator, LytTR family n=1 Tax=Marivirga tractuosa (strain ATCC 23168 / DSM 4126 / NBRC 15989 / NCIMB 1408 / VKM B-1430 / H-43) TaxID=643867 RepID=E4TNJ4_MARTH|nr:LytTR family DNA-binding domain-containing protein [Marivirga tractuosa]ADR20451.1 two component transcriptional regulator, LytTR family [Marivirga tractuosa DSM 4126]BDD15104.1 DNA-binding response regulator [Marivirga tractuosa]